MPKTPRITKLSDIEIGDEVFCMQDPENYRNSYACMGRVVEKIKGTKSFVVEIIESKVYGGSRDWCGPGNSPDSGVKRIFRVRNAIWKHERKSHDAKAE